MALEGEISLVGNPGIVGVNWPGKTSDFPWKIWGFLQHHFDLHSCFLHMAHDLTPFQHGRSRCGQLQYFDDAWRDNTSEDEERGIYDHMSNLLLYIIYHYCTQMHVYVCINLYLYLKYACICIIASAITLAHNEVNTVYWWYEEYDHHFNRRDVLKWWCLHCHASSRSFVFLVIWQS